jgi:hypothetical protein
MMAPFKCVYQQSAALNFSNSSLIVLERPWNGCRVGLRAGPDRKYVVIQVSLSYIHIPYIGHDFFEPQPLKDVSVFYLRAVLHDWPDDKAIKILRNLREIARPETRLVFQDQIVLYACADPTRVTTKEGLLSIPPDPLLPNWGVANSYPYYIDTIVSMLSYVPQRYLIH